MTQFVEQLRNQAKWYAQPGHNARDLMDSRLLEKAADEIECLRAKLEAAEKSDAESLAMYRKARDERDALRALVAVLRSEISAMRAKIARMEQQEPVAKVRVHRTGGNAGLAWSVAPLNDFDSLPLMRDGEKLYALPGAKGE